MTCSFKRAATDPPPYSIFRPLRDWRHLKEPPVSSPPAVHPEPLVRIFAYPAFDHRGDRLHRAGNVDLALGVAHRRDRLRQVDAEMVPVGKAHHTGAVDWAVYVLGETGDERVRLAGAPEEGHVDAVDVVLVDQHGDMTAALEHAAELDRRIEPGRHERAHAAL